MDSFGVSQQQYDTSANDNKENGKENDFLAHSQSLPATFQQQHSTDLFPGGVASNFNNLAVVPDSFAFSLNNQMDFSMPAVLEFGLDHSEELHDPKDGIQQLPLYTSIRSSRRSLGQFFAANEALLVNGMSSIRVDEESKQDNKRKINLFTSQRDHSIIPKGMSTRKQSTSMFKSMLKPFHRRKNSVETNDTDEVTHEGGKHYSHMENVVLVGNIYMELFKNPALKKHTWQIIAENFSRYFKQHPEHSKVCARSPQALERHFKVLKEQNRKNGQTMFFELFKEYQELKQ